MRLSQSSVQSRYYQSHKERCNLLVQISAAKKRLRVLEKQLREMDDERRNGDAKKYEKKYKYK